MYINSFYCHSLIPTGNLSIASCFQYARPENGTIILPYLEHMKLRKHYFLSTEQRLTYKETLSLEASGNENECHAAPLVGIKY